MERSKAIDKVRKLRALAVDRAATGPERELAEQRASEIVAKYGIRPQELKNRSQPVFTGSYSRAPQGGVFVDGVRVSGPVTGRVKVTFGFRVKR